MNPHPNCWTDTVSDLYLAGGSPPPYKSAPYWRLQPPTDSLAALRSALCAAFARCDCPVIRTTIKTLRDFVPTAVRPRWPLAPPKADRVPFAVLAVWTQVLVRKQWEGERAASLDDYQPEARIERAICWIRAATRKEWKAWFVACGAIRRYTASSRTVRSVCPACGAPLTAGWVCSRCGLGIPDGARTQITYRGEFAAERIDWLSALSVSAWDTSYKGWAIAPSQLSLGACGKGHHKGEDEFVERARPIIPTWNTFDVWGCKQHELASYWELHRGAPPGDPRYHADPDERAARHSWFTRQETDVLARWQGGQHPVDAAWLVLGPPEADVEQDAARLWRNLRTKLSEAKQRTSEEQTAYDRCCGDFLRAKRLVPEPLRSYPPVPLPLPVGELPASLPHASGWFAGTRQETFKPAYQCPQGFLFDGSRGIVKHPIVRRKKHSHTWDPQEPTLSKAGTHLDHYPSEQVKLLPTTAPATAPSCTYSHVLQHEYSRHPIPLALPVAVPELAATPLNRCQTPGCRSRAVYSPGLCATCADHPGVPQAAPRLPLAA